MKFDPNKLAQVKLRLSTFSPSKLEQKKRSIGEIREYKPSLGEKVRSYIAKAMADPRAGTLEMVVNRLLSKQERPEEELARNLVYNYLNTRLFNLPSFLLGRAGVEPEQPEGVAGRVGSGVGSLVGFVRGPLRAASWLAPKLPLVGRAFTPITSRAQAVVKPAIRTAATLGTAEALQTPQTSIVGVKERAKQFVSGATTGVILGELSKINNPAARVLATSLASGLPSTLRHSPLDEQILNYGIGAWVGRHKLDVKSEMEYGKKLRDIIENGVKSKDFLRSADKVLTKMKDLVEKEGSKVMTRSEHFDDITSVYYPSMRKLPWGEGWRKKTVNFIVNKVRELKKNPNFALEGGDIQFLVDYLSRELKLKKGKIREIGDGKLYTIKQLLSNYTPPERTPFVTEPPKREGRWFSGLNLWDISLRRGLKFIEKMGFGGITGGGLTEDIFNSAAKRYTIQNTYQALKNNWVRLVGTSREKAADIFLYLDGKAHPQYIIKKWGRHTLEVAKQMRTYLDHSLELLNRYYTQIGEEPVKRRENYITHIFRKFAQESAAKGEVVPDYILRVLENITPKGKEFPFGKKRTGKPGYEVNVWDALDAYTLKLSQAVSDLPIRKINKIVKWLDLNEAMARENGEVLPFDYPSIRENLLSYSKQLQHRPGRYDKYLKKLFNNYSLSKLTNDIATIFYTSQIGGRLDLPIRNLFQHSLIIGRTGFKPLLWALNPKVRNSPQVRKLLGKSKLLSMRGSAYLPEMEGIGERFGVSGWRKKVGKLMKFYKWSDIKNVESAFLAGYRYARTVKKMSVEDAVKFGDETAAITQFLYIPEDRSHLFGLWETFPPLARMLSVFTTWPSSYVEFLLASAKPEFRPNLLKYFITAGIGTALLAGLGVKGWEYFGYTSPLTLVRMGRGDIPVLSILRAGPKFRVLQQIKRLIEGDYTLKDLLFYTFERSGR